MSFPGRHAVRDALRRLEGGRPPRPLAVGGWIAVIVSTVGLFWVSVPSLVGFYDLPLLVAFLLASLQAVTLPLAVRLPRTATLLHVSSLVLIGDATRSSLGEFWPVPLPNLLALIALLIILGLREEWYVSVAAWWLSFLGMTVIVLSSGRYVEEWDVDVLISVTVTLIALAVSVALGQRRRVRAIVASARRDVELEQARRATVEERARIARELHDVVAHSMSIVHIQAESARFRVADLDAARDEFADIARSARAALGEMRQLLSALHPEDDEPFYAPQPAIADIPSLIRGAEKVGSAVEFVNDVPVGTVSPVVELTAYRIVQEALSNVVRHAPLAPVAVTLRAAGASLDIRVENEGPVPGTAPRPPEGPLGERGGHGLRGMRERVALLNGEIVQTPLEGGGYLISARLPTTPREETP